MHLTALIRICVAMVSESYTTPYSAGMYGKAPLRGHAGEAKAAASSRTSETRHAAGSGDRTRALALTIFSGRGIGIDCVP